MPEPKNSKTIFKETASISSRVIIPAINAHKEIIEEDTIKNSPDVLSR